MAGTAQGSGPRPHSAAGGTMPPRSAAGGTMQPRAAAGGTMQPRAEAGFTIVEMLVAMLLMGLVGLTLVRFQTFQLAGAGQVATAALARMEADNRAVDLSVQQNAIDAPVSGTSMNGGMPFFWRATPAPGPRGDLFAELVRIDIVVALSPDGPPAASRTVLRPRQLPADRR